MNLTVALDCAAHGWPVFPVGEDGPLVKWVHGPTPATIDEGQIRRWWRRWPNARVGVATGPASGIVVIDLDTKNGVDGIMAFARLVAANGPVPLGPRVRSPSGGLHLYFRHPGHKIKTSAGQLGEGIDVRGDGGFIVAPGTILPDGRQYRLARPVDALPDLPAWLNALASPAAPRAIPAINARRNSVRSPDKGWTAAIERECADVAATRISKRNERLYEAAVNLSRFIPRGLDPEIVRAALLDAASRCGTPDAEARASIKSAFDWRASISA